MQLHFEELGAGSPIVLLHGMLGASDNLRPVALQLAEHFHVLSVDQRNHGRSPHSAAMSYSLMAEDVNEFLQARGLDSAIILGHSMGGKTAMQLALSFPDRVEKLIVGDIAPRPYAPVYDPIFAALLALDLSACQTRSEMETVLTPAIPNAVLRRFLLKNLGRDEQGNFFWKINLRGIADNYSEIYAPLPPARPFTKPTLFIRGGKSDYVRPEDEATIYELFPHAKIETLEGAGHWLHADQPEEFSRRVLNFLS